MEGKRNGRDRSDNAERCLLRWLRPIPIVALLNARDPNGGNGMLTKPEAERIAACASALRPDWSINGILAVLADERIRFPRTYRDTCLAMVALALDPETAKPTRIFEHGPWWEVARPLMSTSDALPRRRDDDCAECGEPRDGHNAPDHGYERPHEGVPIPEHLRSEINEILGRNPA